MGAALLASDGSDQPRNYMITAPGGFKAAAIMAFQNKELSPKKKKLDSLNLNSYMHMS